MDFGELARRSAGLHMAALEQLATPAVDCPLQQRLRRQCFSFQRSRAWDPLGKPAARAVGPTR